MRETIRQRASSIRMRATTIHQRSSQQLTQPQGIDEVEEEENDMEEEAQQGAGDWEKEDCIAESQAETAVRTVEHWKSFSKRCSGGFMFNLLDGCHVCAEGEGSSLVSLETTELVTNLNIFLEILMNGNRIVVQKRKQRALAVDLIKN